MRAKDIMTTRVVTVGPEVSVTEIARTLTDHHISAVPVVEEDGALLGIVSEGDLLRRPEVGTEKRAGSWWLNLWRDPSDLADDFTKAHGRTARDVMTAPVDFGGAGGAAVGDRRDAGAQPHQAGSDRRRRQGGGG